MRHYLRPSTVWAFASGLTLGSLAIAAAATFATAADEQLPACATVRIVSAEVAP